MFKRQKPSREPALVGAGRQSAREMRPLRNRLSQMPCTFVMLQGAAIPGSSCGGRPAFEQLQEALGAGAAAEDGLVRLVVTLGERYVRRRKTPPRPFGRGGELCSGCR